MYSREQLFVSGVSYDAFPSTRIVPREQEKIMQKVIVITAFVSLLITGIASVGQAKEAPCEDNLKVLRETVAAAKLNDADKAKIADLEAKGVERCNADDDKRANAFFADAMKVMGK
jgi:hypothetical protein